MINLPVNYQLLLKRIAFLLLLYFFCRLIFLFFNLTDFSQFGIAPVAISFFYGLRYDITSIVILNILFIALHSISGKLFFSNYYQKILKTLFLIVNIPFLLINCIDTGLFRFTGKRSGMEIFSIMSFGDDFMNTVPKMIADFWYLLLLFFVLIFIFIRFYPRLTQDASVRPGIFKSIVYFMIFLFLSFVGFRGGTQYKPLNILSASGYASGKTTALILNSSFTVIKTIGKERLQEQKWMTEEASLNLSPVIKNYHSEQPFTSKNVVVIILESFGKEYIGSLTHENGFTPFLDSLINQSLVFTNAYANGKRSIEGIPAVLAGIPALMNDPFITSAYSGNSITSVASLLKPKGYSSCFFHGGTNGTMGFDNFSKVAGFDRYYGRFEYGDDSDFDGSWGIYDEPFLQRVATELNKMQKPFISAVFTLSSHHPYKIPSHYEKIFPKGTLPIHQSILYADYSLKQFFKTVSKMNWFDNTLFVITADHTGLSGKPFYRNRAGIYSIPVILYSRSDSILKGINSSTTQQIDILPTVLDYLHYDLPFFALGNSMVNSAGQSYAVEYMDETHQLISDNYLFITDNTQGRSLFNIANDSALENNISSTDSMRVKIMETKLHSVIQNFTDALIHNKMKP